jgi:hypothetical protein
MSGKIAVNSDYEAPLDLRIEYHSSGDQMIFCSLNQCPDSQNANAQSAPT